MYTSKKRPIEFLWLNEIKCSFVLLSEYQLKFNFIKSIFIVFYFAQIKRFSDK